MLKLENILSLISLICNRYHVPRSWLKPRGNLLVVFEELGGTPSGISMVKRSIYSVCADIYEWQPSLMNYILQTSGKVTTPLRPKAHLSCSPGQKISSIKFASFGTPFGGCGNYREGNCHAHNSYDAFNKVICFRVTRKRTITNTQRLNGFRFIYWVTGQNGLVV